MKFGIPLAIIVHYPVQFNVECYKSCVPDMGPNTILKIKKNIIKRRLKNEIKRTSNIQSVKLGIALAIIVHYTVQLNGVLQKLCVGHGP